MRTPIFIAVLAVLALGPAAASGAAVNCPAVNKELKLGRWPADVALSMGVTLAQVNSCKDDPGAGTQRSAPAPKTGAAKSAKPQVEKANGR